MSIYFVNFIINCPRDNRQHNAQIRYAKSDNYLLPALFNGCDFMDGSEVCYLCRCYFNRKFTCGEFAELPAQPLTPEL